MGDEEGRGGEHCVPGGRMTQMAKALRQKKVWLFRQELFVEEGQEMQLEKLARARS